jgi:hypothetical protein
MTKPLLFHCLTNTAVDQREMAPCMMFLPLTEHSWEFSRTEGSTPISLLTNTLVNSL